MQTEYLREFITLAEKGSFTAASQAVNVSQPTLSNHIRAIELELGRGRLFERTKGSNGAVLTKAGRSFYGSAVEVLNLYDRAVCAYQDAQGKATGRIRVALSPMSPFANGRFIQAAKDFCTQYEAIDFEYTITLPPDLLKSLDNHKIDCAVLVQRSSLDEDRYQTLPLCVEEKCLWVSDSHPLASKEVVTVADIEPYPFTLCTHGCIDMTTSFWERVFAEHGIQPRTNLRSSPTLDDFYINNIAGDDVVIMPKSFASCDQSRLRPDMVLREFVPPLLEAVQAIFREDAENDEVINMFMDWLDERAKNA